MAKDFRASQVETSKLILTGALGSSSATNLGLAVYSGSVASDRAGAVSDSSMLSDVGKDIAMGVACAKVENVVHAGLFKFATCSLGRIKGKSMWCTGIC